MDRNNDQHFETINVTPGAEANGRLSVGKPLRFSRSGNAMTGTPVLDVENGTLALHYADGASVYISA